MRPLHPKRSGFSYLFLENGSAIRVSFNGTVFIPAEAPFALQIVTVCEYTGLHLPLTLMKFQQLIIATLCASVPNVFLFGALKEETFATAPADWAGFGGFGHSATMNAGGAAGEAGGTADFVEGAPAQYLTAVGLDSLTTYNVLTGTAKLFIAAGETLPAEDFLVEFGYFADVTAHDIMTLVAVPHTFFVGFKIEKTDAGLVLSTGREAADGAEVSTIPLESNKQYTVHFHYIPPARSEYANIVVIVNGTDTERWAISQKVVAYRFPLEPTQNSLEPLAERLGPPALVKEFGFKGYTNGAGFYADNICYTITDPSREGLAWLPEAEHRIAQHRAGTLRVKAKKEDGAVVPGALIDVRMINPDFKLGTAVSERSFADPTRDTEVDRGLYKTFIEELFTQAGLENGHKWRQWEDPVRRQLTDETTNALLGYGLKVRGHAMIWQRWDFLPEDMEQNQGDPAYLSIRAEEHILALGEVYKDTVTEWDVVNEQFQENVLTDIIDGVNARDRAPSLVKWFQTAEQAIPNGRYYLNDFGILHFGGIGKARTYANQMNYILNNGGPLNGMGFQGHYWNSGTRPSNTELHTIINLFSKDGIDLQITEFDMYGSGWTPELEAEWAHELYTSVFSRPEFVAFQMWGFWTRRHWQNSAPIFERDWKMKKSGDALLQLALHDYWTRDSGVADANGNFNIDGAYFGDYEVTFHFPDETTRTIIVTHAAEVAPLNPFAELTPLEGSTIKDAFLGYIVDTDFPWLFSFNQGFWYVAAIDQDSFFAYDLLDEMEWLYVNKTYYPWIYNFKTHGWMFYFGEFNEQRVFFSTTENGNIVLPKSLQ